MLDPSRFDTLNPALRDNPYPLYRLLRERYPIFWSEVENAWVLTRHADVSAAFSDRRLLNGELGQQVEKISRALGDDLPDLLRLLEMALFFRNPPAHKPARGFLARVLSVQDSDACERAVDDIVERLVCRMLCDGEMDLVRDFAELVPSRVMGWLLGLNESDSQFLAQTLTGVPAVLDRALSIRVYREINGQLATAHDFLRNEIASRRRAPREDGLSMMLRLNRVAEKPLNDHGLAATASFLFLAGFETTAAMIGSGLHLILCEPTHHRERIRKFGLLEAAVKESVRLEPPIQQTPRYAAEDCLIHGERVCTGQRLLLMIAAANRDPAAYIDPDYFRPERGGPPALSFGAGAHSCIGASIARLEAKLAFRRILEIPGLQLSGAEPQWWPNQNQRRLKTLKASIHSHGCSA